MNLSSLDHSFFLVFTLLNFKKLELKTKALAKSKKQNKKKVLEELATMEEIKSFKCINDITVSD